LSPPSWLDKWQLDRERGTFSRLAFDGYSAVVRFHITERKRAEKVRAASLHTRNLIEASLDPLVTISPDGKITDANKATELVTGVSRDELIGSDTTQPGIQFYTGNFLDGSVSNGGFKRHKAFCLETQHYPDSPNQPRFPSTIVRPGEIYRQTTVHRFLIE
jgi:galactose mutarotase-like enzyme